MEVSSSGILRLFVRLILQVTAGGSICIEALTQSDNPGAWKSCFSVESVLTTVIVNMVDCEQVPIRTNTGSGLMAGPLRVDLAHR